MLEFLVDNFANSVALAVFLVALCPAVESKIALPFALSEPIWGKAVMSPISAFFVVYFGCMLPVALVIWLTKLLKKKTCGFVHEKFTERLSNRYQKNLEKVGSKNNTFQKCLFIAAFVAVPLPMTGVYTGSVIAGLSNLKFWQGFVSIAVGELVSCVVVLVLCLLFENSAFYLLVATLIICAIVLIYNAALYFVMWLRKRRGIKK